MRIRRVKQGDAPQVARLYYETVHAANARAYSPAQIRAWAPRVYPDGFWLRRFHRYKVLVAEDEGAVVGFAELRRDGAIDCFYVHHAHQHRGVGTALMDRMEREARARGNCRLRADVSLSAERFFRRMGFAVLRRQVKVQRNCAFKQAVMEKRLRPLSPAQQDAGPYDWAYHPQRRVRRRRPGARHPWGQISKAVTSQ
jgi:putative acetyltransferase